MEAHWFIDPAFWTSADPAAPGSSLPAEAKDPIGLIWFQTSGSTGRPRWIGLSRDSLLLSATMVNRHLGVSSDHVWGLCLPIHHVGGFGVIARAYEAAAELSIMPVGWDPSACLEWLARGTVNHLSLVPTQLHDLVSSGLAAPSSLTTLVVGGGKLEPSLASSARELGWPVLASYGMTEAGSQIATQSLSAIHARETTHPLPVLPHWQVRVDEDQRISIKGESLFAAELTDGEEGWEFCQRQQEWHKTGDCGILTDDGLVLQGRADGSVKILGELVDPYQIERELGLANLLVVPVPDSRSGHHLVAVMEKAAEHVDECLAEYNSHCPGFQRIHRIVQVDAFPRNEMGKVLRSRLVEMIKNQ